MKPSDESHPSRIMNGLSNLPYLTRTSFFFTDSAYDFTGLAWMRTEILKLLLLRTLNNSTLTKSIFYLHFQLAGKG
jgi:hypothetical protein